MDDLTALALVLASKIRICIIVALNPGNPSYTDIKGECQTYLRREISDGSLGWHLNKLQAAHLIQKNDDGAYELTKDGRKIVKLVKNVRVELES